MAEQQASKQASKQASNLARELGQEAGEQFAQALAQYERAVEMHVRDSAMRSRLSQAATSYRTPQRVLSQDSHEAHP
jgi:hypothetical protein